MQEIDNIEKDLDELYKKIDKTAYVNEKKVLKAFINNRVSSNHFAGTTGYGFNDTGKETLGKVFAQVFGAEKAIVSPFLTSGTHAISTMIIGLLKSNDTFLSISGNLYDTLQPIFNGCKYGCLKEIGVKFHKIDLVNNDFDYESIQKYLLRNKPKVVHIQRSRGYACRVSISIEKIKKVTEFIRKIYPDCYITIDNCYCEFVEEQEATEVGADVAAGSLIKNAGGSLAPTGGYICGKKDIVDMISARIFSPTLLDETGSYAYGYRLFYQGLFMAPHIVSQALKSMALISACLEKKGFVVNTKSSERSYDIVKSVIFDNQEQMIKFVQLFQKYSPIDSFATPVPEYMSGYEDKVIMAAGTFVEGASIELSCDAPLRPPYTAYMQGGIIYEHSKIIAEEILKLY